jgi:hypothetical protein
MNLPRQSFLALAAIGWADGSLQRVESTGLLRAAREAGIAGDDYNAIEEASKTRTTLEHVDLAGMSEWDQVLTYALAAWFAQLDGVLSTTEARTMADLGDKLGLSEALRIRCATAANDIACLPGGGRPERYDFQKLAARLREKLPQIK